MIGQIIVFFKKVQPLSNKPYQNNIFTREEYFKDCDVEIHNLYSFVSTSCSKGIF